MPDNAKAVEQPIIVRPPTGCPPWEHDVSLCGRYIPTEQGSSSQPSQTATEARGDEHARIRKYRAAIAAARMRGEVSGDRTEMARAAIELADTEQAELQGRIDRWKERCLEAQREHDRLRKERDRSFMKYRAEKAEAKVARVEALVEQWGREAQEQGQGRPLDSLGVVVLLRRALAGPEPAATEPPAEVEQILSDLWDAHGARTWWNAHNALLRDRAPRDVWRDGDEGRQAVLDLVNHLADGGW